MTESSKTKINTFENSLGSYRKEIDAIDAEIIALINKRMQIVQKVGKLKNDVAPGECPLKPGREADQLRYIVEEFKNTLFSEEAAANIWRNMIMASLAVESSFTLSVYATTVEQAYFRLTREFFGTFTPSISQTSYKRVVADVIEKKADIGILPMITNEEESWWWQDIIAQQGERPYVFAVLPFLQNDTKSSNLPTALAFGYITPEKTGDDTTLMMMVVNDETSMHRLQGLFEEENVSAKWVCVSGSVPGRRYHLIALNGFIEENHPTIEGIKQKIGRAFIQCIMLGAYANPINLQADEA